MIAAAAKEDQATRVFDNCLWSSSGLDSFLIRRGSRPWAGWHTGPVPACSQRRRATDHEPAGKQHSQLPTGRSPRWLNGLSFPRTYCADHLCQHIVPIDGTVIRVYMSTVRWLAYTRNQRKDWSPRGRASSLSHMVIKEGERVGSRSVRADCVDVIGALSKVWCQPLRFAQAAERVSDWQRSRSNGSNTRLSDRMRWTGVVAAVALLALASMTTGSLVHKTAVRTIDVSTSVVRMTQEVEITNTGSSSVSTYAMAIPAGHAPFLAFVDAFTPNDDVLPVTTSTSTPSDAPTYVLLSSPHTSFDSSCSYLHSHPISSLILSLLRPLSPIPFPLATHLVHRLAIFLPLLAPPSSPPTHRMPTTSPPPLILPISPTSSLSPRSFPALTTFRHCPHPLVTAPRSLPPSANLSPPLPCA